MTNVNSEKKVVLPKTLAACADLLYRTQKARLLLQREVNKLAALEGALKEHFVNSIPVDQTGVAGKMARVQLESKPVPVVEDWDALRKYIKKNNAWELMQKRVNEGAVKERWDDRRTVPGVGRFNAKVVHIHKL